MQWCPLFFGPYNSIWALCCLECSSFDTEQVGGGVGRGVVDDRGVIVGNGRQGWRTGSGWPLFRAGGGTGMAIDNEGGAEDNQTLLGIGSPSPLQVQQRES